MKQGIDPNTHMPINAQPKDDRDSMHQHSEASSSIEQQSYNLSSIISTNFGKRDNPATNQVFDPLFLSEFQSNVDIPDCFQSNFLSHSQQNLARPYGHSQIESDPIAGFSSMPNLAAASDSHYSHHPSSRMNKHVTNEAMNPMNNNNILDPFGWEDEHKLDSIFQFHFNGIQIQERNYPLTGENMDVLHNTCI